MRAKLLGYLESPCCRTELQLQVQLQKAENIVEGRLTCARCSVGYPIVKGVPRFVESDYYSDSFSFEWGIHRKTQFDSNTDQASRSDFGRKIDMPTQDLSGKLVLDAGCGTGRYIDVLKGSKAEIIGIDLSYAIDLAFENLSELENVHFIQADIFNLPLKDGQFDYIYSIGVLHHTTDTRKAFGALTRKLAPGGRISIYVYPGYDWVYRKLSDLYRKVTTRLPKRLLYQLCKLAIPLHYLIRIPIIGPMINVLIPSGAIYKDPQWRVLNTFDWYSPKYQWAHTIEEVFDWFEEEGLEKIRVLPVRVSVAGNRPRAESAVR